MSRYKRLKAAYDFQQRTRHAGAELRWQMMTLPGATLGWVFASFEFVSVFAVAVLLVMLKNNPAAFTLQPVELTHPASRLFSTIAEPQQKPDAHTRRSDAAAAFTSVAMMQPDGRTQALFGDQRPEHFVRYFAYLDSVRGRIPDATFAFFTDYERYSFSDDKSLFGLSVTDVHEDAGALSVHLADPVFDRSMTLTYRDVSRSDMDRWQDAPGLLSHELTLDDTGQYVHSLVFTDSEVMQIVATSIEIDDAPVN